MNSMFISYIPTRDIDASKDFYENKMGFSEDDYGFKLNISGYDEVRIRPQIKKILPLESYCYFRCELKDGFLSYCKELMDKGVVFKVIAMTPGGYSGMIVDPDGNKILVECESYEDDNYIDPNEWDCYRRY
ncbi:VOC family protein [Microbulbifer sp. SSSA002]|uniref:VOC family protein n=1 Tax=Microbulbifer sp. SSSA002 TaxID=3243376 RepID=UPI004039A035